MPQDEQLDDYSPDLITLTDEDGKEFSFEVIDAADYNDERYLAVVPYAEDSTEQLEEDANLIIMRVGHVRAPSGRVVRHRPQRRPINRQAACPVRFDAPYI